MSGSGGRRRSRLKVSSDQATKSLGGWARTTLRRLLGVVARLGQGPLVVDDVLRGLHDHAAGPVVAGPAGPARDLVELTGRQQPGGGPVVLGQRGEQHRPDGDVDADAEGVGAADDLQQAVLGQAFHQAAGTSAASRRGGRRCRARTRREVRPNPGAKRNPPISAAMASFSARVHDVGAHEGLGPLDRGGLGEVHHVDGGLAGGEQVVDGAVQRGVAVLVVERHRALGRADHRRRPAGAPDEVGLKPARCRRAWPTSARTGLRSARSAAPARPSPGRDRHKNGTRP